MATTSSSSVQGLASGIQWQDLIDQLITVDTTNQITPITNKITADQNAQSAWSSFGTAVSTLQTTLKSLKDGTAFDALSVRAPSSPSTGVGLVSATTSSGAVPGTYNVEVQALASAQALSGNVVSDPTAALGLSGQFAVAGRVVTLAGTDSLNNVRDKINALNTGTSPSHVSATVLFSGSSSARLVLTSDLGGSAGLDLRDVRATSSDPSMLTSLGLIDGTAANTGSDGAVRSRSFASSSQTVASLVTGATAYPAASTIMVNGRAVTVDVQNNSLADIATAINAQSPNSASVESTTSGGVTTYALKISGTVAASAAAGSQPVLDLLGLVRGTTSAVKQQIQTTNVLQDSSSTTATGSTALLGLKIAGANGAQSGDTFTIAGTKPDGVTRVSFTETVDGTKTVSDLLTDISNAFSTTGRHVTAQLVGGKITLTDDAGGDSGMSFSIAANNESGVSDPVNGGSLSFGSAAVTTTGRLRELTAGSDARIVVNGVSMTRSTNTVSDAVTGVTLNLLHAESGTAIPVTISRDTSSIAQSVSSMVSAYNTVHMLVDTSTAAGGALAYNSSMRSAFNALKAAIISTVSGMPSGSTYTHAAVIGITLDKTGVLSVDSTALADALAKDPGAVKQMFQTGGTTSGTGISYLSSSSKSVSGNYDIAITRAATTPSVTGTASNFTYDAGVSSDTMTIADVTNGVSVDVTLETGDTAATIASKLNAAFQSKGARLSATTVGGALKIVGLDYGSAPSFRVSYASTDGSDPASQLGIAAATVQNGLDVQGSFSNGSTVYTATGKGQTLSGDAGTDVDGLMILYTGASNGAAGHIDFTQGIAGIMSNVSDSVAGTNGTVASQNLSLTNTIAQLGQRQTNVQARLDAKRAALTAQYTAMEAALSKIQSQGTYLTQQLNSIASLQSSSK